MNQTVTVIDLFDENKMIANLENLQAIMLGNLKSDLAGINIKIEKQNIQEVSDVKVLVVHIEHKLNFNLHIDKIC